MDVDVFGVLGLYVIWGLTFIYEFVLRRSLAMLEGHPYSYNCPWWAPGGARHVLVATTFANLRCL